MKVLNARRESPARVSEEVAAVILDGGTVIFPTDTVYGIGADPLRLDAVARIFTAKARPPNKPLSLHLGSVQEFLEYAGSNALAAVAARRLLPGAVTIVVRRPNFIDEDVSAGFPTIGLRVPADDLCRQILERSGPLAATSANISGQRAYRGDGSEDELPPADLVVQAGPTKFREESTVIDLSGPQPRLIRAGAVSQEVLRERLGPFTVAKDRS